MKNKFRHRFASVLDRYSLKAPMTARENVRYLSDLDWRDRDEHNAVVRINTQNPEDGQELKFGRPRIIHRPTKALTTIEKHRLRLSQRVDSIIRKPFLEEGC